MDDRIQILSIIAAGALLLGVLELVRRRRLQERYALLWLFSAVILLGLAVWRELLAQIAKAVGIIYPPNALFVIAFGFILVLLLHFSLAVSRLSEQSKVLAQRQALLEERQRELEQAAGGGAPGAAGRHGQEAGSGSEQGDRRDEAEPVLAGERAGDADVS